jgi:hypothetical protein
MPKLRNVFPEWADDSRFWCHPLEKRVTAGSLPAAPTVAPQGSTNFAARQPIPAE